MDWERWTLHVVEPETCKGQEAPRLAGKRPWRAFFGEQEMLADLGRNSANIVGQTGTLFSGKLFARSQGGQGLPCYLLPRLGSPLATYFGNRPRKCFPGL